MAVASAYKGEEEKQHIAVIGDGSMTAGLAFEGLNHAGVEIYPSNKFGKLFQKYVIGATHHDVHHTKFNYNYGLYFTFWDRIFNTLK